MISLFHKKQTWRWFSPRVKTRNFTIIGGLVIVVLTIVVLVAVSQLDVIREYFSRASGKPADLTINTKAVLGPLPRPWRHLAQGGEGHDWRLQPLAGQVKAIKPAYIRIDHLYDFYDIVQGTPGNLSFDFSKLDPLLDDILATGAKPYIALSYMPPAISAGDIVAKPQRWQDWQLVVQKTVEHISGTKGISEVYYEVWNEPDLFGGWKYYGDKNYLTLYTYAVKGAQNARGVKPFKIGGPGITALYKNWFDALAKHAIANNLRYDFFSWHRYTTNLNQYPKDIGDVYAWIQQYPQLEPTLEFHITEWGHDSENHTGYDGRYGAAHTVAGAIKMTGLVQKAFVFEIQDGKDPQGQAHWGRWGLFTHQDAGAQAKPRYYALQMLDSLGDQRLEVSGEGYWVKALAARDNQGNTQVVVVNYDAYAKHSENVPITFTNIQPGKYLLKTQLLNGQAQEQQVATTAAILKTQLVMPVNTVAKVELSSLNNPEPIATPRPILPDQDAGQAKHQPYPTAQPINLSGEQSSTSPYGSAGATQSTQDNKSETINQQPSPIRIY
ncbi:MAG: hypothetical protein GF390_03940 [Candidatus Pacebacteria bacterium]|nr:hypothetical protein [Candidatus Paceibacterota bacterium]